MCQCVIIATNLKKLTMKKISITLASALVLGLSFTSCSSDDNGGAVSEAKILGKWEFNKEKYSANGVASAETDYEDNEEGCSKDYIEINEDGTSEFGDYWNSECELDVYGSTWSLDGKTLMIDGETYTVQSVSGSSMKLKTVYTEDEIEWTEVYTFTKAAQ